MPPDRPSTRHLSCKANTAPMCQASNALEHCLTGWISAVRQRAQHYTVVGKCYQNTITATPHDDTSCHATAQTCWDPTVRSSGTACNQLCAAQLTSAPTYIDLPSVTFSGQVAGNELLHKPRVEQMPAARLPTL